MKEFTLVIGNKNYSSWSLRPWAAMTYFKIPFDEIVIPLFQPGFKEKILEHSPSGKVPLLKHKDIIIWDSLAICEYLNEALPQKQMWPSHKKARALARSVTAEMHSGFLNLRKNCPMNVKLSGEAILNDEVENDVRRITAIWTDCRRQFGKSGKFLFGKFSIADAFYAPVVWRFNSYGVKLSGEPKKYFEAMLALPLMKDWREAALKEPWEIAAH